MTRPGTARRAYACSIARRCRAAPGLARVHRHLARCGVPEPGVHRHREPRGPVAVLIRLRFCQPFFCTARCRGRRRRRRPPTWRDSRATADSAAGGWRRVGHGRTKIGLRQHAAAGSRAPRARSTSGVPSVVVAVHHAHRGGAALEHDAARPLHDRPPRGRRDAAVTGLHRDVQLDRRAGRRPQRLAHDGAWSRPRSTANSREVEARPRACAARRTSAPAGARRARRPPTSPRTRNTVCSGPICLPALQPVEARLGESPGRSRALAPGVLARAGGPSRRPGRSKVRRVLVDRAERACSETSAADRRHTARSASSPAPARRAARRGPRASGSDHTAAAARLLDAVDQVLVRREPRGVRRRVRVGHERPAADQGDEPHGAQHERRAATRGDARRRPRRGRAAAGPDAGAPAAPRPGSAAAPAARRTATASRTRRRPDCPPPARRAAPAARSRRTRAGSSACRARSCRARSASRSSSSAGSPRRRG